MRIGNGGCRTYVLQPLFEHREMYAREQKAIDLHQPRLGALEEAQRLRGPILESVVGEQRTSSFSYLQLCEKREA